jgi:hypothetical protein
MDLDLRKTATDAMYIVVGAGVLGFQQAQVRRRETKAKLTSLRQDTTGTISGQANAVKAQADLLVSGITSSATAFGAQVRDQVSSQVGTATGVASTVDPRVWIDPVVGDLKSRVEPLIEQLRSVTTTVSLPDSLPSLPTLPSSLPPQVAGLPTQVSEQVGKAIQVGKARVQSVRGGNGPTAV